MKLKTLTARNFRAIAELEITDLPDAVVLAGPNGCGKSVVLDAIRLLKSAYGSYQQDEWQT
jgi:predicted ATPase